MSCQHVVYTVELPYSGALFLFEGGSLRRNPEAALPVCKGHPKKGKPKWSLQNTPEF